MTDDRRFDAVVVGAGTAGSATAALLALRGRRVALVDQREIERAGARWVNGVPTWMFEAAGLAPPEPPELRGAGRFVLTDPTGAVEVPIEDAPAQWVDMRALVGRLQRLGRDAGVVGFSNTRLLEAELDARGRIDSAYFGGPDGPFELHADLFVDATGLKARVRDFCPALARDCPPVRRDDLCSAAQEVREITDPDAARDHLERSRLRASDNLCRLGAYGGFSTANFRVEPGLETVDLLSGCIADGRDATGPRILEDLRRPHPWVGPRVFGGAGIIPLRRPYDRLAAPGVALVGDAACQVFSAHGSGIGFGLIAARELVDAVCAHGDLGSQIATWDYQANFHRKWGGCLATYDVLRRVSQALAPEHVTKLLGHGLLSAASYRAALDQQLPALGELDLGALVGGARRAPGLATRLAVGTARIPAILAHYRLYPQGINEGRLARWSARAAKLTRTPPDLHVVHGG